MRRRVAGWGLLAYGAFGILLVVLGALTGLELATRVERLAADADGALAAASRATDAAADSFTGVDGSLAEAERSSESAAQLSRRAASTLDALAVAMELSILGSRPLQPLGAQFGESAGVARDLADTLEELGGSLRGTRSDVTRIGAELDILARELSALRDSTGGGGAPPLRLFVVLLLIWLSLPAVAALLVGLALLGWRRGATWISVRAPQDPAQAEQRHHVEDDPDDGERRQHPPA